MTWDETKQTLNDRPDIDSAEKLTSADWNDMVADQKDHATRHEDGGVDELNVQGLSGLLADPQTPDTEDVQDIVGAFTEAATGSNISVDYDDTNDTLTIDTTALNPEETRDTVNELLVGGSNTTLTYDNGNDTLTIDVDAPTTAEFNNHSTRHESGGSDELSVAGLSGDLADAQDPKDHTTTHQSGGSDEIPLNGLELPAGAQIDEDGGDLVVRDSGGSIVLRRDEGAGTWDFVSEDVTGIASLEAGSVSADNLNSADLANATAGTVLVAQGDGTFTMDAAVDDSGNVLGGDASGDSAVSVEPSSSAPDTYSIALGYGAVASANGLYGAMALGKDASTSEELTTAIGYEASAKKGNSLAVGPEATANAQNATAIGDKASATNSGEGVLGGSVSGTTDWIVPGDFTVNGSKNFEIPAPARPNTHDLRHGNYEGDVAGGLIYRREVTVTLADGASEGTVTIQMPDWFGPLATDVDVMCQAQGHFGDAYAERDEPNGEEITVTANASGDYKLIIYATRDDANVPNPEDHSVTKPKGVSWDGDPRAYYRDAPDVDVSQHDGVGRVEQFFDHGEKCDPTPCESAFENWRITFDEGERVDVDEPMNADIETIVSKARDDQS